jgi:cation-transporting ATPase E
LCWQLRKDNQGLGQQPPGNSIRREWTDGLGADMERAADLRQIVQGLSEQEVVERRQHGLGNDVHFRTTRSFFQILRHNAFTFINVVLFAIGLLLILMGQYEDAVVTAGLVLLNVVVTVYQESRAKHKLEEIALLTRPRATVVRNGQEKSVDPSQVVLDDVLVARPGDQIVVDGQVVGEGQLEVDESLLTGESEPILKHTGEPLYSGSFCVAGVALYRAQKVGADSLVNQLTARARTFRQVKTPLQRDIDLIIRVLIVLTTQIGLLLGISFVLRGLSVVESVRVGAVLVALVPQGLFFMTTVAYAMGAVRVASQGALIQQANAIESSSHVDLLCLDKTGTLTTNSITLFALRPLGEDQEVGAGTLRRDLGDYAASASSSNRTLAAIHEAFGGQSCPVRAEVPFSSERKWSALGFDDPDRPGVYFLGAPEVLSTHLRSGLSADQIKEWTSQGLRVLLFAYHPQPLPPHGPESGPQLPGGLIPLALLSFSDELRLEARETLRHFSELGIGLKIISGDNPQAVAALARQVGVDGDLRTVSGLELEAMDDAQFEQAAREATIFGRITPQQKERLVYLFRQQGHYVAMIGDGVNDVLSLKRAHVGVAMQSGSAATRGVADVVLLGDSFAALPVAFREGQRIVKGMEDIVRLLLTRTLYVLLLIVATRLVGVPFPVTPKHNSILALLTVGIPILAIAAWARPGASKRLVPSTRHFVFPAAFTVFVVSLAMYLVYLETSGDVEVARTALTTTSVLCGLVLIPFVEPPTQSWVGGDELSADWRPTLLALGMLGLFSLVLAVPPLRTFYELTPLRGWDYLIIVAAVTVWALLLRFTWRARLFERLLSPESGNESS